MTCAFSRLVRFRANDDQTYYGEAGDTWQQNLKGLEVETFIGSSPFSLKPSGKKAVISEILCPLVSVPAILGIGLNYKKHAEEANLPLSNAPIVFCKNVGLSSPPIAELLSPYLSTDSGPKESLAGPYEDVPVHAEAKYLDYECELAIVMGHDAKDIKDSEDPLQYVLGYTAGNDLSARYWQFDPKLNGGQHGNAKSFDKFAPIGPVIVSPQTIGDAENLRLRTWVDGDLRQDGSTDDLLFGIKEIIRFLTVGKTLRKGTVILTGTPSGVAAGMKEPVWLKDGQTVEIEIEKIGRIANKLVFY